MENVTKTSNGGIAVKWGLIIGILSCILATVNNMFFINSGLMVYLGINLVTFILGIVLMYVAAKQLRTAQGGYITLKEAFSGLFILILITVAITFVYGFIYTHFIDPDFITHMKESTLSMMEKTGVSEEKIDETARNFDERMASANSAKGQILTLLQSIVLYSVFGFIVAAIVKKKRPLEIQEVQP